MDCKRKRLIPVIVATALVMSFLSGCSPTEAISVIADMEITFSGADGYGVAEVENAYTWVEDLNLDTNNDGENDSDVISEVQSAVTYELDKTEGLSNGDTVTLTVSVDNAVLAEYGYSADNYTNTYTVSGLSEGQDVDIFDGVTLDCSGIAPFGTATVNKGSEDYGFTISYSMDRSNGLSNGDTVVVTAEYTESSALKAGVFVKSNTKEFTVSGLQVYLAPDHTFPEETLTTIQGQVSDEIHIRMEQEEDLWRDWAVIGDEENEARWNDEDHTSLNEDGISLEYLGLTLQAPVDDAESTYHNLLNVLYRVNIHATYQNGDDEAELNSAVYLYYYYTNVIMNDDGTAALDTSDIFSHDEAIFVSQETLNAAIAEDSDYTCSQLETATIEEIQQANEPQQEESVEENTETPETGTESASSAEATDGTGPVASGETPEDTEPAAGQETPQTAKPATEQETPGTTGGDAVADIQNSDNTSTSTESETTEESTGTTTS